MLKSAAIFLALVVSIEANQATTDVHAEARRMLQSTQPLDLHATDVVRAGVVSALVGQYVIGTVPGVEQEKSYVGPTEYVIGADGTIRFKRVRHRDSGRPEIIETTLIENTDAPAILCDGRKQREGHLSIRYTERQGKWSAYGAIAQPRDSIDEIWWFPPEQRSDGGTTTIEGRRARGVKVVTQLGDLILWIDVASLLPLRFEMRMTGTDGKRHIVAETFHYPRGKTIERPAGVKVPDCV